jgi:hypothetical protein
LLFSVIAEYNLYIADIQIPYNHSNYNNGIEDIDNKISDLYYHASTLWSISIIIFIINFIIIMNLEIQTLAITRGFQDPLPLSRKSSGWDATNQSNNFYSIFTGTILIQLPSLTYISFYSNNNNNHRIPPRSIYNTNSSRSNNNNNNNNNIHLNITGINYLNNNNNLNDSKDTNDDNNNNNNNSARRLSAKKRDSKRLSRIRNNDNISPSLVASSLSTTTTTTTNGIPADNNTTMITDALTTASSSSSSSSSSLRQDKEIEMSPIRQSP